MKLIEAADIKGLHQYPLFFQPFYAKYEASRGWKVYILLANDGTVIPIRVKKGRFIISGQFLYPPVKDGERLSVSAEGELLEQMVGYCRQAKLCDFLMPPLHYSVFYSLPSKSYYTEMGILVVDLQPPEDEIWKNFNASYRNKIRKAQSENLYVNFDNQYFSTFYALYKRTHEKQGIYFDSEDDLKKLISCLGEENCRVAVVKKDETIFGAALLLWAGSEGYFYHGGAIEDCPYPAANKLLHLEVMKWLKQRGIKRYCMGGYRLGNLENTKYEGIQTFKLRFGAAIEKGYHFYYQVSWKYTVYKRLLNFYLSIRGIKQNTAGQDYK